MAFEQNVATVQTIAAALSILPPDKRNYWLGYAEGVIDMRAERERHREHVQTTAAQDSA